MMELMPIPAIILAAGESRRLGRPKQLVRMGGETLLDRTFRIVREAGAFPILVVLGANQEAILGKSTFESARVVSNPNWRTGFSSSICAGIHALQELLPAPEAAMILVCDQPGLSTEHLLRLLYAHTSCGHAKIVASYYAGVAGIPAIFPAHFFPALLSLRADTGARSLLRDPRNPIETIPFEQGEWDIDAPTDLLGL